MNDTTGLFLTNFTPLAIASGDMDSSGQDDMIFSFDAFGTVAFKNLSTVETLHEGVVLDLATGNVDGN